MTTDPTQPSEPSTPPPSTPPPTSPPSYSAPPAAEPAYPPAPGQGDAGFASAPPQGPDYGTAPPAPPAAPAAGSGFDLAKASTSDRGIAIAALLFLIALVLTWASVSIDNSGVPGVDGSEGTNGFSSGLLTFGWILLVAAAVIALLPAIGANVKLPFPRPLALVGLTGLVALITLLGFIDALTAPDEVAQAEALGLDVSYSAGIGAYLGMLVALGAFALAFMSFRAAPADRATV